MQSSSGERFTVQTIIDSHNPLCGRSGRCGITLPQPPRRIATKEATGDYRRADRIFVAYEGMLQVLAYIVVAYTGMARIVMAYIVMACILVACVVMAYIVRHIVRPVAMAYIWPV